MTTPAQNPLPDADAANLNLTPAPSPNEDDAPSYAAFKCFFFTPKRGDIAGAFCVVFEGTNGKVIFQNFWVTRTEAVPTLRPTQDWRDFNRLLTQIGPFDKILGDKLFPTLPELLPPADCTELFENADNRRFLNISQEKIRKHFERTTHYFLELSCELQQLTRQDLVEAQLLDSASSDNASEGESGDDEEKSFAGTLIQCLPVIDPIHGIALSALKPGDLLEVQIKNDAGAGGLLQQFLNATSHPSIFPVESIEKDDSRTRVYLTISEEIRGLMTLTKDLRLRTKKLPESPFRNFKIENFVFAATLVIALLVVLVAVKLLFF